MKLSVYTYGIIIAGVITLISGCSPSSSSLRYSSHQKQEEKNDKAIRFSKPDSLSAQAQDASDKNNKADLANDNDEDVVEPGAKIPKYDLKQSLDNFQNSQSNLGVGANFANLIESVKMAIVKYDESPYHYGGSSREGIDCSGFTQNVFQQAFAVSLPRSAREQYQVGDVIGERDNLKFGDLVFFNTRRRVRPGHVGIYIGDGKFVHASSSIGVSISSLNDDYYNKKYMGGRRVVDFEAKLEGK